MSASNPSDPDREKHARSEKPERQKKAAAPLRARALKPLQIFSRRPPRNGDG